MIYFIYMYQTFVRHKFQYTEPKRKTPSISACIIGGKDQYSLECNQCKKGSEKSTPQRTDAITHEPLEEKHVEYISPDSTLKCCYNVSTLDRIRSPTGIMMQPPHFRIPMTPGDAKKINEQFGVAIQKQTDSPIGSDTVQQAVSQNYGLQAWARNDMGSSRLWACPICWSQLVSGTLPQTSEEVTARRTQTNPIQRCIDYIIERNMQGSDGALELCASMATTKTLLKKHLREAHGIQSLPSDLLEMYSLRGDDGILHRYLQWRGYGNDSAHGALLSYWRHNREYYEYGVGFNKFVFLYLNKYAEDIANAPLPGIDAETQDTFLKAISRPFSTKKTESDEEFVDDQYVSGDDMPIFQQEDDSDAVKSKINEYKTKDATGYLTHEELLELERKEMEQAEEYDSSDSEDGYERYKRDLANKRKKSRLKKHESDSSDSDDEDFLKHSKHSGTRLILEDSDEDDE